MNIMPDWPHAPIHRLDARGTYMVTAGTYRKEALFNSKSKLDLLQARLFASAPGRARSHFKLGRFFQIIIIC